MQRARDLYAEASVSGRKPRSGFGAARRRAVTAAPGHGRGTAWVVTAWVESPLGPLLAGSTAEGICLLEFTEPQRLEKRFTTLRRQFCRPVGLGRHAYLDQLQRQLAEYFAGQRTMFDVPLNCSGTPFQQAVWRELLKVPYGTTCSYADIARAVGVPAAVRAVGAANGSNRVAIIIPCHRVINKDGKLGGYGGGLWRKQFLLDLERRARPGSGC